MIERQLIFKTLDHPIRILFWTVDEFLVMTAPFFLGMCLGSIILIFSAPILKCLYSKIKKKLPYGAFKHEIYWRLPTSTLKRLGSFYHLPSSHQRELFL